MPSLINLAQGGRLTSRMALRLRSPIAPTTIGILLILLFSAAPVLADGGAVMSVTPTDDAFYCGESVDITYGYTPDVVDTPTLRGYSIRIVAPYGLAFDAADIIVNSPLGGVNDTYLITMNGTYDYSIDFTFLDPGAGLSVAADLFTITMHDRGFNIPNTVVGIDSGRFRTPENLDIVVDITDSVEVDVLCIPPPPPALDPEPAFTTGTSNTLTWTDDPWYGAFAYNVYMSTTADFAVIEDESGWIPGLSHEFTGLTDGQQYFYKVRARNFTDKISLDSNIEQSTQDATAPVTSIDPLDPVQYLVDWDIPFQVVETLSGFDKLELFYRFDGGAWISLGDHSVSPIEFTAIDGDGLYEFYTVGTDVAGNLEPTPAGPQAATTLDTSQPFGSFVVNAGAEATNNPAVILVVSVIRADEMRFSNDGVIWDSWVPLAGVHPWTIPATEQVHTVYGEFRDLGMQVMPATDDIEFDITSPGPVSSPAASPGHESVLLTWTNPADPDFHNVEIWRSLLHDGSNVSTYPSYIGSTVPTPPADRAAAQASTEWELVGRSAVGATSFTDSLAARGVYYYEFFAADPANNFSGPTGLTTRATNYVLGDVTLPFDGLVKVEDITTLGATYGLVGFNPLFNGHCDVGPTHDGTGTGIPLPDDQLNIDDMMIFAMNFASAAKSLAGGEKSVRESVTVSLTWKPLDGRTWALDLTAPCPLLKGIGLAGNLPEGVVPELAAGEAVTNQPEPFFLANANPRGLEAGLAILGSGRGLTGTGTLLTVTLPAGTDPASVAMGEITLDLRDINNRPLDYDVQGKSDQATPAAFWLAEAYPNPFNPSTTIRFSITGELPVRLEIYGMDGRRVAVLIDETLAAGPHETVWSGSDDSGRQAASGVYFAKLLAGPHSRVRKMTLMK
ncbi:MAG: T9SS type A sorting domain-containing protein [Candidatus Krumholzibacteriota bacterium]